MRSIFQSDSSVNGKIRGKNPGEGTATTSAMLQINSPPNFFELDFIIHPVATDIDVSG
jgi:hypothetical protein